MPAPTATTWTAPSRRSAPTTPSAPITSRKRGSRPAARSGDAMSITDEAANQAFEVILATLQHVEKQEGATHAVQVAILSIGGSLEFIYSRVGSVTMHDVLQTLRGGIDALELRMA